MAPTKDDALAKEASKKGSVPNGKPRGRAPGQKGKENSPAKKEQGALKKPREAYVPTGKPRGRPPGQSKKTKRAEMMREINVEMWKKKKVDN